MTKYSVKLIWANITLEQDYVGQSHSEIFPEAGIRSPHSNREKRQYMEEKGVEGPTTSLCLSLLLDFTFLFR